MTPLLYSVPASLYAGYQSGHVQLVGALLKDAATGQILGHVQQTGMLDAVLRTAMGGLQTTVTGGFSPLGMVAIWQNQQIKGRLQEMQGTLGLLQNLQIGTLAVSGLGLGVSVAGFAMMLKRLKSIEGHIDSLGTKVDQVTRDRREDDLKVIFADIGSDLETVDSLASRRDPQRVAEDAQVSLARNAGRLEVHFAREADIGRRAALLDVEMELLWSIAAAIRLCHEAGLRALFVIDEVAAAERLAGRQAKRFMDLSQALTPDALARLASRAAKDPAEASILRRAALPRAEALVTALRETVASVASQADLAALVNQKGIAGPAYLAAVEAEDTEALLYLPATERAL